MTLLILCGRHIQQANIIPALEQSEYRYITATTLEKAYDILANSDNDIHVIIVEYSLISGPGDFLRRLSGDERFRDIAVIAIRKNQQQENIKPRQHTAPVYWLRSPFTDHSLLSMIVSAENDFCCRQRLRLEIQSCHDLFKNLMRATFHLKTFEQAASLTGMLSQTCPEPDRIALGLFELLANAIEHGNLEISHDQKWTLLENNLYSQEISHRLALPAYRDRYVTLRVERENNLIAFRIEDQGAGFNYDDYREGDLSVNQTNHGRGIALARHSSFDYLEYSGRGNKVLAITKFAS